jgi:hypothetical protein
MTFISMVIHLQVSMWRSLARLIAQRDETEGEGREAGADGGVQLSRNAVVISSGQAVGVDDPVRAVSARRVTRDSKIIRRKYPDGLAMT